MNIILSQNARHPHPTQLGASKKVGKVTNLDDEVLAGVGELVEGGGDAVELGVLGGLDAAILGRDEFAEVTLGLGDGPAVLPALCNKQGGEIG